MKICSVVREMARVLRPGGVFLFDYLNVDRELDKLVERETLRDAERTRRDRALVRSA